MRKIILLIISILISVNLMFLVACLDDPNQSNNYQEKANHLEETPNKKDVNPEGILLVESYSGHNCYWESNGAFKCTTATLDLNFVNSDTGEVTFYKTFSSDESQSCQPFMSSISPRLSIRRFSDDLSKVTAFCVTENGEIHVGWLDEKGEFTDVSEKVTNKSDFDALTRHTQAYFYGEYFYFRDDTDSSSIDKRVPINDLSSDMVEEIVELGSGFSRPSLINILPDGSVSSSVSIYDYYGADMKYAAPISLVGGWVSENTCIGSKDDMIYKFILNEDQSDRVFAWDSNRISLIPYVKGRKNWNAVISPNRDKVVFLSQLESGNNPIELFVVGLDGGDPQRIDTDYSFPKDKSSHYVEVLTWK